MLHQKHTRRSYDESGMVSFLITLIMLAVITLIIIGFTQVANRNRRQALDRQLSTQAFYAAESGVNQAVSYIKTQFAAGTTGSSKTTCGTDVNKYFTSSNLSADSSVQTTCLLVNAYPPSVQATASVGSPVVVPIIPVSSTGVPMSMGSLTFTWTSPITSPKSTCSSPLGTFATAYTDCDYGLLRVDLMQFTSTGSTAQAMADNTVTLYLQPLTTSTPVNISGFGVSKPKSYIGGAKCSDGTCTVSVSVPTSTNAYYARLLTLYNGAPNVTINGFGGNSGNLPVNFAGQYLIDATGRAQDVLRRVAVRYTPTTDTTTSVAQPSSALQISGDVCKRLTVVSTTNVSNDGCSN